jgi:hypothetical protein
MFEIQLFEILALYLLDNPAHALDSYLNIEVDTNMPADPLEHLQAKMMGQSPSPNELFILHLVSIQKKAATSPAMAKLRQDRERLQTAIPRSDEAMRFWPVVHMLVFTSEGAPSLEVPYIIDPQAMERVRARTP